MPKTATTAPQTKDDLNALGAQLLTLKQQRQQATATLQRSAQEINGSKPADALKEVERLTGFIARLDGDIERHQADYDVLAEVLKTDAERAAEQAAIALKKQQSDRRDELKDQLASLIAAFNLQSAQLLEQWQSIRAMLREEHELADALGDRNSSLLGAHAMDWKITFFLLETGEYGHFQPRKEDISLYQLERAAQ